MNLLTRIRFVLIISMVVFYACQQNKTEEITVTATPVGGTFATAPLSVVLEASDPKATVYYRIIAESAISTGTTSAPVDITTTAASDQAFLIYQDPLSIETSSTLEFYAENVVQKKGALPGSVKKESVTSVSSTEKYVITTSATATTTSTSASKTVSSDSSTNSQSCGSLGNGDHNTRVKYQTATVAYGEKCASETQTQTCTGSTLGDWTGTFTFDTCTVESAPAILDTLAPTGGSIHINWRTPLSWDNNGGDTFTSSRNVTLLLHAGDDVGVTSVSISNTNNCADGDWEDYTPTTQVSALDGDDVYQKSWTLTPTRGTANVSAKFKDAAGNVSGCTTTSIQAVTTNSATDIYAGANGGCFIDNGHAKCWGNNTYGQLGYGITAPALGADMPSIDLGTGRTVRELAVGYQHTCALLDNYGVKCWGYNLYGQLGYGSTSTVTTMGDSLAYVALGGNAAHIAAGRDHTCAIMSTGDVKCWGHNIRGQLGVGNTTNIGDQPSCPCLLVS